MLAVVFAALAFWTFVFLIYFTARGVSPIEFFAGAYEPYDAELGRWKSSGADEQSGLLREERWLLPDGNERKSFLIHQVRYRDARTGSIVKVADSTRHPRRRTRSVRQS